MPRPDQRSGPRTGQDARAEVQKGAGHRQGTWSVRLDAITDCVADLNAQARRHGCRCAAHATFTPQPGGWFVANTTHDAACPAVGGGR